MRGISTPKVTGGVPGTWRPGEHVDDAPEQDRLGESGDGERHIGQREHRADAHIGPELSENADVKPD